jgi:hypothetical protein
MMVVTMTVVVAMVTTTTVEAVLLLLLLLRSQNADCPALASAGPVESERRLLLMMIATLAMPMAMTTIDVSETTRMEWRQRTESDHRHHHRRHHQDGDLLEPTSANGTHCYYCYSVDSATLTVTSSHH